MCYMYILELIYTSYSYIHITGMNEGSSRSHSVFTITVNQRNLSNNTATSGKLVLVDLAGMIMTMMYI